MDNSVARQKHTGGFRDKAKKLGKEILEIPGHICAASPGIAMVLYFRLSSYGRLVPGI